MDINPEQFDQIKTANTANILKKLKAGKTLSRVDWTQLQIKKQTADDQIPEIRHTAKSLVELAEILGVARQTVDVWKRRKGAPKPRSNGTYDVLKWVAFIKAEGLASKFEKASETPDETELRLRKLLAEVEDRELRVAIRKGLFIPLDEVRDFMNYHHGQADALFMNKLENELPPILAGLDAVGIRKELAKARDEFKAILRRAVYPKSPKLENRGRKPADK